jgi:hypothetical protein
MADARRGEAAGPNASRTAANSAAVAPLIWGATDPYADSFFFTRAAFRSGFSPEAIMGSVTT